MLFLTSCAGDDDMSEMRKVLVAYATRYNSTREIAEEIGSVLGEEGVDVDVRNIIDLTDSAGYQGMVIGSPIYMGKWLPEAVEFVQFNQEELRKIPVAVFTAGISLRDRTEENIKAAMAAILAIRPYVHPFDVGLFAGKLDIALLNNADRDIIRMKREEEGDFRNWDEIAGWAGGLEALFKPL